MSNNLLSYSITSQYGYPDSSQWTPNKALDGDLNRKSMFIEQLNALSFGGLLELCDCLDRAHRTENCVTCLRHAVGDSVPRCADFCTLCSCLDDRTMLNFIILVFKVTKRKRTADIPLQQQQAKNK